MDTNVKAGELISGLLAGVCIVGTVFLAFNRIPIPDVLLTLDGLVGGAFFLQHQATSATSNALAAIKGMQDHAGPSSGSS